MLTENMPLRKMLDFEPDESDMAMLDLDVIVYVKAVLVSQDQQNNYGFIRFLFTDEEFPFFFKESNRTLFYDFDGRNTDQEKVITVFELYSLYNFDNVSAYLQERLNLYSHEADVLMDLYTHDSRVYRLSNLDGVVKLEEMQLKNAA